MEYDYSVTCGWTYEKGEKITGVVDIKEMDSTSGKEPNIDVKVLENAIASGKEIEANLCNELRTKVKLSVSQFIQELNAK